MPEDARELKRWPFLVGQVFGAVVVLYIVFLYLAPLVALLVPDLLKFRSIAIPVLALWLILASVGPALALVALLAYRSTWRRKQTRLNDEAASIAEGIDSFSLYLRPFVTSGRIKVPNGWSPLGQRVMLGDPWDLELALATLLNPSLPMIAIGHQARAIGAAKVLTTDADWQREMLRLARRARLILCVPLDRPSTLWEVETILGSEELRDKTLFIMPPSSRFYDVLLFLFRRSHKSRWRQARIQLANRGIHLPEYRRRGGFFIMDSGGASRVAGFHGFKPARVQALLSSVAQARSNKLSWFNAAHGRPTFYFPRLPGVSLAGLYNPYMFKFFVFGVITIVMPRIFVADMYIITNASMLPGVSVGDFVVNNKLAYGYSPYSFFGDIEMAKQVPQFHRSGLAPRRGDIIAYYTDRDEGPFVKRVIGLPGDQIAIHSGRVIVNGKEVERQRLAIVHDSDNVAIQPFRERLPEGPSFEVWHSQISSPLLDNMAPTTIPSRRLFVMGDYRSNSADSRISGHGLVDLDRVRGRIDARFNPLKW